VVFENIALVGVVESSWAGADCECGAVLGRGVAGDGCMTSSRSGSASEVRGEFTGRNAAAMVTEGESKRRMAAAGMESAQNSI
jgi:hypothetical protein